jgi:hypothetical protein
VPAPGPPDLLTALDGACAVRSRWGATIRTAAIANLKVLRLSCVTRRECGINIDGRLLANAAPLPKCYRLEGMQAP